MSTHFGRSSLGSRNRSSEARSVSDNCVGPRRSLPGPHRRTEERAEIEPNRLEWRDTQWTITLIKLHVTPFTVFAERVYLERPSDGIDEPSVTHAVCGIERQFLRAIDGFSRTRED